MSAEGDVLSDLSERVALLVREIEAGKAWGSVLLPLEHGDTCGATLNEAEEALCVVVERLREELERERHDAWVALDGTNVKALRSALEEIRDGIFSGNQAAERARTALQIDDVLAPPVSDPFEVVKMFDGTWNVRDDRTDEWVRDAVHLSKPEARRRADEMNAALSSPRNLATTEEDR